MPIPSRLRKSLKKCTSTPNDSYVSSTFLLDILVKLIARRKGFLLFISTQVIAEASKKIFSSVKSKIVDVVIDLKDLDIDESAIRDKRRTDDKPEWIDRLEPIQNLATIVGANIRNRIRDSLNKGPPGEAAEMLRESISKDVYKGNAAGSAKKIVREVKIMSLRRKGKFCCKEGI